MKKSFSFSFRPERSSKWIPLDSRHSMLDPEKNQIKEWEKNHFKCETTTYSDITLFIEEFEFQPNRITKDQQKISLEWDWSPKGRVGIHRIVLMSNELKLLEIALFVKPKKLEWDYFIKMNEEKGTKDLLKNLK